MATRDDENPPDPAQLIADECLAVRIRLLNRTISGIYDEALRPLGMTVGQLNILVAVAMLGPVAQAEIGRRLNMEKSTLSRNIERMRRNRWVVSTGAMSGRGQVLSVPTAGQRQLDRALPLWQEAQDKTRALLGPRGTASLRSVAEGVWAQLSHE